MIEEHQLLEIMAPLVVIVRDREALYLDMLSFIKNNFDSSSTQLDQIYIFAKFIQSANQSETAINAREISHINDLIVPHSKDTEGYSAPNTSKEMMRLQGRLLEILEASIEKVRKTLFSQNGHLPLNFVRFKKSLHRLIRQQSINLLKFSNLFLSFSRLKYRKQMGKIKSYLKRLQTGEHISLKDIYSKQGSDTSISPDQKSKNKSKNKVTKKSSQAKEGSGKTTKMQLFSIKKNSLPKSNRKNTLNLKSVKKEEEEPKTKSSTAMKLLKYYSIMEITKKQFLQDYLFEAQAQEEQRSKLLGSLMDKNKLNLEQIKEFQKTSERYVPARISSDESPESGSRRNISMSSKISARTSFLISKRKPSFSFESSTEKTDGEIFKADFPLSKTIKNFSNKKQKEGIKPTQMRPKPSQKASKKIFVTKSPMIFEDDIIPKAEVMNRGWAHTPLTGRQKTRRNDHIRLKKHHNPSPLDESTLGNSFHFSQHPI